MICPTCSGEKVVAGLPFCARHDRDYRGCGCAGRSCGIEDAECPECRGTGVDEAAWQAAKAARGAA